MTKKQAAAPRRTSESSKIADGIFMHANLGVKLDARAPGISDLPDGRRALSPARVRDIADAYNRAVEEARR